MKREYPYYAKSNYNQAIVYFVGPKTGKLIEHGTHDNEKDIQLSKARDAWAEERVFCPITNLQEIQRLNKKRLLSKL